MKRGWWWMGSARDGGIFGNVRYIRYGFIIGFKFRMYASGFFGSESNFPQKKKGKKEEGK